VDIAQRAVQVVLVARLDVRHAAFVIAHADLGLELGKRQFAIALRLARHEVPERADAGQQQQGAQHRGKNFQRQAHR